MPSRPTLVLVLFFSTPFLAFSQKTKLASEYLQEGKSFISSNPEKAFALLEKAKQQLGREDTLYVQTLAALSSINYKTLGERRRTAMNWMKDAISSTPDNKISLPISDLCYFVGKYYTENTPEADSALFYFHKALAARLKLVGEKTELVAQCYHAIGDLYKYEIFDFTEAETYLEKSLQIREQIKSTDKLTLATTYYNLATTNRSQRDFDKALSYGVNAIKISEEIRHLNMLELTHTMVANIYRDMGQSKEAIQYYHKSIALNRSSGRGAAFLAWHYGGLGETYKNDSMWSNAIINFTQANALYEQNEKQLTEGQRQAWVYCQLQMAETYRLQKNFKQAFQMIVLHHETLKRLNMAKGRLLTDVYTSFGNYYIEINKPDSALNYFQRALTVAIPSFQNKSVATNPTENEILSRYYIYRILIQKAKAFEILYRTSGDVRELKHALKCLVLAEKLLVRERNGLDVEESKWRFSDDNFDVYEHLISLLFELQKNEKSDSIHITAFEYFEKSKARALSEILAHGEKLKAIGNKDSLFVKQNSLKQNWLSLQHQLTQELEKPNAEFSRTSVLQQKLMAIDRSIQHNKNLIEAKYPGYFRIKYDPKIPSLSLVQKRLESETLLLEFFFGNEYVYALGVHEGSISFKKIARTDSVEQRITHLMGHFTDVHSALDKKAFVTFTNNAFELYQLLISPFQSMLSGKMKIQIIPDGLISQIPFEVLIRERSSSQAVNYRILKYALREYSFGYAYSTSILLNNSPSPIYNPTLLAMGFTGGRSLRSATSGLSDIDGARLELSGLKAQFDNGKFLLGDDVSESNFKQLAPDYDIIHLAVHGQGNPSDQFASSLFFRDQADSLNDGQLHAYELYGITLHARLAVLTACESGLGKSYKGEGMMSIASAFSYAGCQNVLMSLWKVNDQSSVGLMNDFYTGLLLGDPVDNALMNAKKKYLEQADELTSDPKIWAPLVAYGDLRPIFTKEKSNASLYIFLAVITMALLFVVSRLRRTKA